MCPFHGVSPIGSKWEPSSPSTTPVTSMRFGVTELECAIAPTGSNTTVVNLASVEYAKAVIPISQAML